uniref:Uncharacterized protein n=1 Tax=Brassica oleracea TaxID=3712 RepID=A0A3P6DCI4_BRAOL|nr:unnamed protein product [Brassica oleracea]
MGDCVIGAFISIFESVAINFGTNLLKLRHNKDEKKHTTGSMSCVIFQLLKKLWLIFYPKHIVSSAVNVVTVWRLPYSRRYPSNGGNDEYHCTRSSLAQTVSRILINSNSYAG